MSTAGTLDAVKEVLGEELGLGERARRFAAETPLLGNLPELDSTAVLDVILALEERFDIRIEDDEIGASTFETVGALAAFVQDKLATRDA